MAMLESVPDERTDPYLHVFLHGQARRERYSPPVFYRRSSSRGRGMHRIFLSDPVLDLDVDCSVGWYLWDDEALWPVIEHFATARVAAESLNGVVWHGSSAGGWAAIRNALRSQLPALAIAVAPQNDPRLYKDFTEFSMLAGDQRAATPFRLSDYIHENSLRPQCCIFTLTNDRDHRHLRDHIYPLWSATNHSKAVDHRIVRNGQTHGTMNNDVYWREYGAATRIFDNVLTHRTS
ncbi:hypothetical protein [Curtobacterium sp. 8I-2]|uniref:hypothetical protein n=1 Tax=Curtobacterium sp. 8I-2 TaxID=2653136 RepID=UPI00135BF45F|nr:hypothetical protein [Curtobacterium sp. 8I-2]